MVPVRSCTTSTEMPGGMFRVNRGSSALI
jgi:hypothetical protein